MWIGIIVAVVYGTVAVAANFVNKLAVKLFPLPNTILLIQTITTLLVLQLLSLLRVVKLPSLRTLRAWQLLPLTVCYVLHAVLVLFSLAFLSVPMYNTLKRLTPVLVLGTKAVMDRRWPDPHTTLSVLLIVGGCMVAGAGDLSFDGQGYTLAMLCAFMQALYILLAERASTGAGSGSGHGGAAAGGGGASPAADRGTPDKDRLLAAPGSSSSTDSSGTSTAAELYQTVRRCTAVHVSVHGGEAAGGAGSGVGGMVSGLGATDAPNPHRAHLHHLPTHGSPAAGAHGGAASGSMGAVEMLYSIALLGLPIMVLLCTVSGEGAHAPFMLAEVRVRLGAARFAAWLGSTAVIEGMLTGSIILCTQLNSALTTSIVGVLKGVVSSVLGFFLLGGVKFHVVNVAGIAMNMLGGVWYSVVEYRKKGQGKDRR